MHKICYTHSSSREILVMKILTDVKDVGNATMHKANLVLCKPLQQQFK